jgi:histidinol dehydrogenase
MMIVLKYPERSSWSDMLKRPALDSASLEVTVASILADVRLNGDRAVKRYALQFDRVDLKSLEVSQEEIASADTQLSAELKSAIGDAKNNIEMFHSAQREQVREIETASGVRCWRRSVGIEKVGLYIPGGSAPLFSTVLMLGVPARLADCREVVLCTPSDSNGGVDPTILYAAKLVGVARVFKVGGVQAIAAMAYGTESIPQVYKIFGPGNQYVTCAKQLVNKEGVAIDMPAGPSEVAVIADRSCIPAFVAADLLSQAEHGADSQVILVSNSEEVIKEVNDELAIQLPLLKRGVVAEKALKNSKAILVRTLDEGMVLLNEYAAEHLIIACKNADELANRVVNAGSVFIGNYSCESAGDYASGTNHTLPTNGYAKAYSGVSLDSFVKKITFQKIGRDGLATIGRAVELMAEAEGLDAHKNAVSIRLRH